MSILDGRSDLFLFQFFLIYKTYFEKIDYLFSSLDGKNILLTVAPIHV